MKCNQLITHPTPHSNACNPNGNKRHKNQSILIRSEAARSKRERDFPTALQIKRIIPPSHTLNAVDWSNVRLIVAYINFRLLRIVRYFGFVGGTFTLACIFWQSSHIALTLMIIMLIMDLRIHSARCSLLSFSLSCFYSWRMRAERGRIEKRWVRVSRGIK